MRARTWLIGVAFVATIGCLPRVEGEPLGHPRIRVWLHDIDATGAKEVFTIDPAGRFVLEDWVAIGETKWTVHHCLGQLPSERVAPVFASFAAADLDGTKQTFGEDGQTEAGPQTLLLYVQPSTAGHPRDRAEFDRLIALVEPLRAEATLQCPDHPRRG